MNSEFDKLDDETKSKTKIKKAALDITEFGRKLLALKAEQIIQLPLDETIINALIKAKSMQRIALKRQVQYIGKLLRHHDDIEQAMDKYCTLTQKDQASGIRQKRLEQIREKLIDPETVKVTISQLVAQNPTLEAQKLRQLVRNHHNEVSRQKPLKSYRLIFQLIKDVQLS